MNPLHNNPPDPIDEATAPYADAIAEAETWLDGAKVENEGQMKAVDDLLKSIKAARKAVADAEESEAKPIYDKWKAAKDRYKPTLDDLSRIASGLVAIVGDFKRKLAEEQAERERAAARAAREAREAAEAAARAADAGNIKAQRAAARALAEAQEASKAEREVKGKAVKGLRKVTRYRIADYRAALHDIAKNDKDAMTAFIEGYVKSNHKARRIDGVEVWEEKEAF